MLWVYVLRCGDGTLYTGMTADLTHRLHQHRSRTARCKFTRRADKHPLALAGAWPLTGTRGDALRLERYIKSLPRAVKLRLVSDPQALPGRLAADGFVLNCGLGPLRGENELQEEKE